MNNQEKDIIRTLTFHIKDIFPIAYRYLNNGCKSRKEYEYLVNTLIDNTDIRRELLK